MNSVNHLCGFFFHIFCPVDLLLRLGFSHAKISVCGFNFSQFIFIRRVGCFYCWQIFTPLQVLFRQLNLWVNNSYRLDRSRFFVELFILGLVWPSSILWHEWCIFLMLVYVQYDYTLSFSVAFILALISASCNFIIVYMYFWCFVCMELSVCATDLLASSGFTLTRGITRW